MLSIKRRKEANTTIGRIPEEGRTVAGVVRVTSRGKAADCLGENIMQPTLLELSEVIADHIYDMFDLDRFSMEADGNGQGFMHAFVELINTSPEISMKGWVWHKESDEVLCELPEIKMSNCKSCEFSAPFQIEDDLTPTDLLLSVEAAWFVDGHRQDVIKTVDCTLTGGKLDYIHIHPVKKEKPEDAPTIIGMEPESGGEKPQIFKNDPDHIVTCFLRYPEQYMDVDYMVNFGRPYSLNYRPLFGIPGQGSVFGISGTTFVSGKGECYLYPENGGVMLAASTHNSAVRLQKMDWMHQEANRLDTSEYHTYPGDIIVEGNGANAWYSMMTAWKHGSEYFNEEGNLTSHYYDYELRLDLNFLDEYQKTLPPLTLLVTSRKTTTQANYIRRVLPLRGMYGCVANGTLISTVRGLVPIEEIKIGDMVVGIDKPDKVMNIWRGEEPNGLISIKGDGFELLTTADHPVVTEYGMKRAGKLKEGERVMTENGLRPVQIMHRSNPVSVYNLDTENEMPFFAEKVLVGGMQAQNNRYLD